MKYLIWGGNGWIGSMLCSLLIEQGHEVIVAKSRIQDLPAIVRELSHVCPDRVLNTAGITGRPTVDWCEDNKEETYLINSIGVANLAYACFLAKVHLTNYATGCIYTYGDEMGRKFTEMDTPNFEGSTYSKSKVLAEKLLEPYAKSVLTLRIRMPISDDLHAKSLVTKLIKYTKVVNIPNSLTVLSELLPISVLMSEQQLVGIYNFTNVGAISHNEILQLYKEYVNQNFTWQNFSEEEQNAVLKSKRSNCELDVSKLLSFHPVSAAKEAMIKVMKNIATQVPK